MAFQTADFHRRRPLLIASVCCNESAKVCVRFVELAASLLLRRILAPCVGFGHSEFTPVAFDSDGESDVILIVERESIVALSRVNDEV